MKKILSLVLVAFLALASFTACQNSAGSGAAKVENVAMNKISIADAKANIGNSDYLFLDTRKAADYQASHIDGAVNADLEKVVTNNDYAAGTEAVKPIVQGGRMNCRWWTWSSAVCARLNTRPAITMLSGNMPFS